MAELRAFIENMKRKVASVYFAAAARRDINEIAQYLENHGGFAAA